MKRTPNLKVLVAVTVVVLVGGLGASFYEYTSMVDVENRVQSLRKKADDEKSMAAKAEQTSQKVNECSERLAHLEKSMPKTAYVPTLLQEIEKVGREHGINVTGVRPLATTDKKDDKSAKKAKKAYDELKIEVKGRGSYLSVLSFVTSLKDFPKIVATRSITMAPKVEVNRQPSSSTNLDVTIELKTYIFPDESSEKSSKESKSASAEVTVKNG